ASDGVDELQVEVARRHELIGGHLKRRHWPRALRAGRAIAPRAAIFASPAAEAADPSGLGSMRIFMSRRAFSEAPNESSVFCMSARTAAGTGARPYFIVPSFEMPRNFSWNS